MSIYLTVNRLIEWKNESGEPITERILWVAPDYTILFTIEIFGTSALPMKRRTHDVEEALSEGDAHLLDDDPFAKYISEESLATQQKKGKKKGAEELSRAKAIRDKRFELISPLIGSEMEPDIFLSDKRGPLIAAIVEMHNAGKDKGSRRSKNKDRVSAKTVYVQLKQYWQRGKNRNALLPDYSNSGGFGVSKAAGEKKRGRPRNPELVRKFGEGINVCESIRKLIKVGFEEFFNCTRENPLRTAFKLTIKKYFLTRDVFDERGQKRKEEIPPNERITFEQFEYWSRKDIDIEKTEKSRRGSIAFARDVAPHLGSVKAPGPGYQYLIDAVILDVYVISQFNSNWIVGRPVAYVVMDVYSRLVVGIYVGLEGPSWLGAMMALANVAEDKVSFCEKYGFSITEAEWSCREMPYEILADNGEMAGRKPDTLINNLDIRVVNAPPYRPDWKGILERYFRTIQEYVKPFAPGFVIPRREGSDYRLDATLTLKGITRIILKAIVWHNNYHRIKSYSRTEEMISNDVPAVPIKLWNFGRKYTGNPRYFPEDIVKLNLLPTAQAKVTPRGIIFKRRRYYSESPQIKKLIQLANVGYLTEGEKNLDISFDLRRPDVIYVREERGRTYEKLFLHPSEKKYFGKSIEEIEYLVKRENLDYKLGEEDEFQGEAQLMDQIEAEVAEAKSEAKAQYDPSLSKTGKLSNITNNRGRDRDATRTIEGEEYEFGDTEPLGLFEAEQSLESLGSVASEQETKISHSDSTEAIDESKVQPKSLSARERRRNLIKQSKEKAHGS